MKKKILLMSTLVGITTMYGQKWETSSQRTSQINKNLEIKQSYRLDLQSLRNLLKDAVEAGKDAKSVIISLPTAEGKIERFAVYSNPVMEKSLADFYQLGSYVGIGVDDPDKYVRLSTSPQNMQSMMIKEGKFQFIEPISTDSKIYGVFYKTSEEGMEHGFKCDTSERNFKDINKLVENGKRQLSNIGIAGRPTNTRYRDFRLALVTTGEYSQYHLAVANTPTNANDNVRRGVVLAAMNATMTRVNGIFEREFAAHFTIQNRPELIYLDPATDFYTPSSQGNLQPSINLQLQRTLTNQVTNANYDIGHVFHLGGNSGNAGIIAAVCVNPINNNDLGKGAAYSQDTAPSGDRFDLIVAHEMGHQLGANHTFSTWTEISGANVEPGGGTTLMSYPGTRTIAVIQPDFDANFHYKSIAQVLTNLEGKPTCGTRTNITTNTAPVIAAVRAYRIPKGTAYYLEATARDAENNPITYSWEQYDSVGNTNSISGDSGRGYNPEGALSRSYPGTISGRRYFPKLETVINGTLTDRTGWETVSYIPRQLNYAVTVRDQHPQRPMLSTSETTVTVGNEGPFKFNGLTTSSVLYNNASNAIIWEVANTNSAPYGVANVRIDYTTNNGTTWTNLVASTPNTGLYNVQMPGNVTGAVKLRISAINSIFYAISPAVTIGRAPTSTSAAPTGVSTIDSEIFKTTARVSWNSVPGATYSINYRRIGSPNWLNAVSQINSVVLNNLEDETNYEVRVRTMINNSPGTFSDNYQFRTKGLKTGVDYCLMTTGGYNKEQYHLLSGLINLTLSNLNYSDTLFTGILPTYLDFSEDPNRIVNLSRNTTYTLSYRNLGNNLGVNDWIQVWIDYNRNGIFENSELVGFRSGIPTIDRDYAFHSGTINFTVPANAYAGDKLLRMRVASTFDNPVTNPCGSPLATTPGIAGESKGSFKDFSVRIRGNNARSALSSTTETISEVSIYPNPADTFVEVKNLKGKADYKIYSAEGRLVQEGKVEGQRINVASLVKGVYVITIKDDKNTYNTKLIKK